MATDDDDDLRDQLAEVLNRDDCLLIDGLEAFIRAHSAEVWEHGHRTANPVIPDTHRDVINPWKQPGRG